MQIITATLINLSTINFVIRSYWNHLHGQVVNKDLHIMPHMKQNELLPVC